MLKWCWLLIIEFLVSQGISFDDTLVEAIKYHFNDTAKWIYENYSDQNFKITVCIESFNTEMFLYFIEDIHFLCEMIDQLREDILYDIF